MLGLKVTFKLLLSHQIRIVEQLSGSFWKSRDGLFVSFPDQWTQAATGAADVALSQQWAATHKLRPLGGSLN